MADTIEELGWRDLAAGLERLLSNERFDDLDAVLRTSLIVHNLVERGEQMKPCPTCGTQRVDFHFWRVTAAGRLIVAAGREQAND